MFDDIENRNALYVALNRLAASGKIKKFSRGTFFKPTLVKAEFKGIKMEFLSSPNATEDWKILLGDDGVLLGPRLYNSIGITNQNAFVSDIGKFGIRARETKINMYRVAYRPIPIVATTETKPIIQLIEVVSRRDKIQGLEEYDYRKYVGRKLSAIKKDILIKSLSSYPRKTIKSFLKNLNDENKQLTSYLADKVLKPYEKRFLL
jgi:hypothetical protein